MKNKMVVYEVELDHPNAFVSFEAPDNLSNSEILVRAIDELTRNTVIWSVKKKELTESN